MQNVFCQKLVTIKEDHNKCVNFSKFCTAVSRSQGNGTPSFLLLLLSLILHNPRLITVYSSRRMGILLQHYCSMLMIL